LVGTAGIVHQLIVRPCTLCCLPSLQFEAVPTLSLFDLSSVIDLYKVVLSDAVLLNKTNMLSFFKDYSKLTAVVEKIFSHRSRM
jgi:hypothetical protein